jgi:Putative beta-barrel porin-2, OmpL-like. bbp2
MNYRFSTLLASAAGALAALAATSAFADDPQPAAPAAPAAAPAAPAPTPPPFPAMSASLAGNATPITLDLGILGSKVTIGGVISGFAQAQNNPVFNGSTGKKDQDSTVDLSNAQLFINKSDGVVQYFVQVGTYSLPNLSDLPYTPASKQPGLSFGNLAQGFVKFVPNSTFSVEVGALPTLVGAEYTFTFENLNVERGLLWGVEPAVSRGVQANAVFGPLALSVAFTDGFYSNRYNTISGLATWTINSANTLAFDFQTPTDKSNVATSITSPVLNNETIYNLMYTNTTGPWTFNPYLQYTSTPANSFFGYGKEESWGAALLVNYAFDAKSALAGFSLPARVEYMSTHGTEVNAPNLAYGPGSNAWSFTVTPTYQYKQYFIRAEASYVTASKVVTPDGYGVLGNKTSQVRGILETGVIF